MRNDGRVERPEAQEDVNAPPHMMRHDDVQEFSPIHLANGDSLQLTYHATHTMVVVGVTYHVLHEAPHAARVVKQVVELA